MQLDFGATKGIDSVVIYNRNDGFQSRLGNFEIWVSNSATDPAQKCYSGNYPSVVGPLNFACAGSGRYVRVVQLGNDFMNFDSSLFME